MRRPLEEPERGGPELKDSRLSARGESMELSCMGKGVAIGGPPGRR